MGIKFNSRYWQTNRGIIKILQIIIGLLISGSWGLYRGHGNYQTNTGYSINSLCLLINIVFFVLHLINIKNYKLERVYTIIGMILYIIIAALIIWHCFDYHEKYGLGWDLPYVFIYVGMAILYLWDFQILNGDASD
ncbi:unnamed protein product, partial [Mesorhabditis spiculigera]